MIKKSQLGKIDQQYDVVNKLFESFSNFGACDSEPQWVLRNLIRETIAGRNVVFPANSRDWQLYTGMLRVEVAAKSMTRSVKKLITLIKNCPISKLKELEELVD